MVRRFVAPLCIVLLCLGIGVANANNGLVKAGIPGMTVCSDPMGGDLWIGISAGLDRERNTVLPQDAQGIYYGLIGQKIYPDYWRSLDSEGDYIERGLIEVGKLNKAKIECIVNGYDRYFKANKTGESQFYGMILDGTWQMLTANLVIQEPMITSGASRSPFTFYGVWPNSSATFDVEMWASNTDQQKMLTDVVIYGRLHGMNYTSCYMNLSVIAKQSNAQTSVNVYEHGITGRNPSWVPGSTQVRAPGGDWQSCPDDPLSTGIKCGKLKPGEQLGIRFQIRFEDPGLG